MLYSSSIAILDFVRFADQRVASGKYSHSRLIVPGSKQFRKWIQSLYSNQETEKTGEDVHRRRVILDLGQAYHRRKDPEHLPPENIVQSMGEWLRVISSFLRSTRSLYGFRVACAATSIGIIAYLEHSHAFFVRQRLVWAMVMQTISMGPTAGQTVLNFALRSSGTVIGMVGAMVVWYIPVGHIAGVIVLFFIWTTGIWWIPLKRPVLQQAGIVSMLTIIVIIASEMEAAKLGEQAVKAGGQPNYPTYLLAAYRLVDILGGVVVAFIWTIFPYPISDHSVLRLNLGGSLYLLAKYYSLTHETLIARARGDEGDMTLKSSAGRRLEKARHKAYANQSMAINGLHSYADSIKWEIQVGGRFPRHQYETIIDCMQKYVTMLPKKISTTTNLLKHHELYQPCRIRLQNILYLFINTYTLQRPLQAKQRMVHRLHKSHNPNTHNIPPNHLHPRPLVGKYNERPTPSSLSRSAQSRCVQ